MAVDVKDIKLGEVKKFYITGQIFEVLGICMRIEDLQRRPYVVLYGYDKNGTVYANQKLYLDMIQEIKAVRFSGNDKTRELFTKLYENYQKGMKYNQQYQQLQAKLAELSNKMREQNGNLLKDLHTIMHKNGVMSVTEFTDEVHKLIPDYICKKGQDLPDRIEARIYDGRLIIARERQVDRLRMVDVESLGLGYREYDDNVFLYSYDEIKNLKIVKQYVEKAKVNYNIKNLKAKTFVDFSLSDKGHLLCEYGVDIKLTKPMSKAYAKEIVTELFKK